MTKKIFIVSAIIFLIVGVYLAVQFFVFQKKTTSYENTEVVKDDKDKSIENEGKESSNEKIKQIIEGGVKNPFLNNSKNKILYFNQNNFISTGLDGTTKSSIGTYPFTNVENIEWSSDNNLAIVKDSGKYFIFDVKKNETKPFKSDADNVIWGKIPNQLVYKYFDNNTKKRSLNISDLSGEKWQEIMEIPFRYANIELNPKNETLVIFSKPTASEETQFFIVNLIKKESREMKLNYKGVNYKWSPDGEKLLFSYTKDAGKTNLAILQVETEKITELNFPGIIDKCVWTGNSVNVYCASPTFETAVILPDDWMSGKSFSSDTFWKINTIKGEQKRIIELAEINKDVDASFLFLDKDEKNLFFIDKKAGGLLKINLN